MSWCFLSEGLSEFLSEFMLWDYWFSPVFLIILSSLFTLLSDSGVFSISTESYNTQLASSLSIALAFAAYYCWIAFVKSTDEISVSCAFSVLAVSGLTPYAPMSAYSSHWADFYFWNSSLLLSLLASLNMPWLVLPPSLMPDSSDSHDILASSSSSMSSVKATIFWRAVFYWYRHDCRFRVLRTARLWVILKPTSGLWFCLMTGIEPPLVLLYELSC